MLQIYLSKEKQNLRLVVVCTLEGLHKYTYIGSMYISTLVVCTLVGLHKYTYVGQKAISYKSTFQKKIFFCFNIY